MRWRHQKHEIIPVNDLVAATPAQDGLDLAAAMARDARGILGIIG
jgi:hypothetical protein